MGLLAKLKSIFRKRIEVEIDEKNYLGVDINQVYNNVDNTYHLCNKLASAYKEKERVVGEYERVTRIYTGIQQIQKLNPKQVIEFENYANTYIGTKKDKVEYVSRIKGAGEQFDYLEDYEEDITAIIENIKNVEEKQRAVKNDINYIEGEKGDLVYRAERLVKAQKSVKVIMISLLMVFALAAFVLAIMYTNSNIDIFIPAVVMIVIVGFFGMWIYIFRRYVIHEINKNHLLRQRAVELLNKIKVKYVHNEQFLDYEYRKYKVKSGDILEDRWEQYKQNRKDKHKIHKMSSNIIAMEEDIERLLTKNNIHIASNVLDNIKRYATNEHRHTYLKETQHNKNTLKNTIEEYDKEIMLITKILIDVRDKDTTEEKVITKIVDKML